MRFPICPVVCRKIKRFPLVNSRLNARFPTKIRVLGGEKTSTLFIPHFSKFAEKQDVFGGDDSQYDQRLNSVFS